MLIESLRLVNFRSFPKLSLSFSPGINWIIGPNATGKSSLLEALYFCIAGRSFRTARALECIHYQESFFQIDLLFQKCNLSQRFHFKQQKDQRKIIYNHNAYSAFTSLFGLVPGVIFTTEDIQVIKGAPSQRRLFLDIQIAQSDPLYIHHYARFNRALKQRNALLKTRQTRTLSIWDQELAKSASYMMQRRQKHLEKLSEHATPLLLALAPTEKSFSLKYKASYPSYKVDEICAHLREQAEKDKEKYTSLTGPHRDDFMMVLNGKDARHYSSEGQKVSLIASLKLASWHLLKELLDEEPLMLIDDIGSCLDEKRKQTLISLLGKMNQCFLSSPEPVEGELPSFHSISLEELLLKT